MFTLLEGHNFYRRAGLILLLLQFLLFVFGLPPFQAGIWYQSEPTIAAIFLFGIFNSIWLAIGIFRKWLAGQPYHPIWLCMLLWVGWQLLATVYATSSWRSWFGTPDIGEGTGRSIALLLMVMLIYPLWQVASYRRIILAVAAASLTAQCALHLFNPPDADGLYFPGSWVPAKFPAYLAFMAGSLWIAAMSGGYAKNARSYGLLIIFMLATLYVSQNKSAIVLLAAMACSLLVMALPRYAGFFLPGRNWRALAVVACLLPMGWVAFCGYYGGTLGKQISTGGHVSVLEKDGSLGSRIALNQVVVSTMRHEPARWLIGDGWGRFTDDIFKYALVDGVYVFRNGVRNPNWTPLEGYAFHSHSEPLEALLSLGLPGMLLWFALPIVVLITLPKPFFWGCAPMVVAQVVLSYFWFEMPQCLPYDALAWAALGNICISGFRQTMTREKNWVTAVILCAGMAMTWSAWQQIDAMRYGERINDAIKQGEAYEDFPVEWLADDIRRGGDRLQAVATGYAATLSNRDAIDANDRGWYAQLMAASHIAALSPRIGARVASTELWMQYKLLLDFGGFRSFSKMGHQAVLAIPDSILLVCSKAPLRDDYATMFLVNLSDITHKDVAREADILNVILTVAPNHRAAMWVLGQLLVKIPKYEDKGDALLKRAASLGVETVYPVSDKELAEYK